MNELRLSRGSIDREGQIAEREWLVTNGIGGFASSTLCGMNTRRYHGLLVASLRPPVERVVLVAALQLKVRSRGRWFDLGTSEYADGTIAPRGFVHLRSFHLEGLIPVWTWGIGEAVLEQRLWMRHGENSTYITLKLDGATEPIELAFEPLVTYRDYHWQLRGERPFSVESTADGIRVDPGQGGRPIRILSPGSQVRIAPEWHWNTKHREESARGLDDREDLFRPACFSRNLAPDEVCEIVLSAEEHDLMPARAALVAEFDRQGELKSTGIADSALEQLKLAADQFVVERRDARGRPQGKTVIAGYPWFSDWGRDTMIALPGLLLATGRPHIAASVLRTFARFVDRGMLPNRFPDQGEAPEYNTVDAGLWFFVAVRAAFEQSRDTEFLKELYPTLKDMIDWHVRGTRYGIGMDAADSLLKAGEAGVQLTWMDAKVGDWVVTPRTGKPVEINALWYNAVAILAEFANRLKRTEDSAQLRSLAIKIKQSFAATFWYAAGGYLYDVVDGEERDASLRPNQLFALSLPFPLLDEVRAKQVVDVCATHLLTPVGLRSLAPTDSRYVARYGGGPRERDGAYHQGTVWTWLLGPFVSAHYRVYRDAAAARRHLRGIATHLAEGCIGQVSEIMDAEAPHEPRGCFAQAWGVAEILRTWSEINECERQESPRAKSA